MTPVRRRVPRPFVALAAIALACLLVGCGGSGAHGAGSRGSGGSSTPIVYGIGDAPGNYAQCALSDADCCVPSAGTCAAAHMQGFFDNPLFRKLTTAASAHRVGAVRLFVAYDAVSAWNGSTSRPGCVPSRQFARPFMAPAGYVVGRMTAIDQLLAGVIEAHHEGLTPLVTITGYPERFDRPSWDQPMPDPTTVGGSWTYRCGLHGILDQLDRLPTAMQPHVWEPLNEPETFPIFRGSDGAPASECRVGADAQPDGPAKAACAQAAATRIIQGTSGHRADTVIAGDFQHPYASYLGPYVAELSAQLRGRAFPATWSVHAYHELTAAYTGIKPTDVAQFDIALAHDTHGRARSLWVTEAGTVISSTVRAGHCAASGADAAGTLGACVSGKPARQAVAARVFFSLPTLAHAVPITHLFWYQFKGGPGWDSGLVDPSGRPRPVFCMFFGGGHCPGSPIAA